MLLLNYQKVMLFISLVSLIWVRRYNTSFRSESNFIRETTITSETILSTISFFLTPSIAHNFNWCFETL